MNIWKERFEMLSINARTTLILLAIILAVALLATIVTILTLLTDGIILVAAPVVALLVMGWLLIREGLGGK